MSMTKLIYGADFDPTVGVGAEIVDRQGELTKQASTIFGMDYSDMKPDDRHVGIHVVALGDAEHYGANRNGDLFPKEACVKYHDTFVKQAHVFRHHRNTDPATAIGIVKASAYNEPMGRVELFIHADKEKAAPELARLEKEGEIPFSMACLVGHDRCSVCGNLRKQAGGPSECEHVRDHLGELLDDGRKVGTFNDEPKFFDISFVGRPADRIAWNLKVASADLEDSVRAAAMAGVAAPDDIACDSPAAVRKLGYARELADTQGRLACLLSKSAAVVTARDRYLYEFRKVASSGLDDETVSRLRELPVGAAMRALADHGIVMDVPTFLKYASGDRYAELVAGRVRAVEKAVPVVLGRLVKRGACARLCNETLYDARPCARIPDHLSALLRKQASDPASEIVEATMDGVSSRVFDPGVVSAFSHWPSGGKNFVDMTSRLCDDSGVTEKLAEAYISYQLSAVDASVDKCTAPGVGGSPAGSTAAAVIPSLSSRNLQAGADGALPAP